MGKGKKRLTLCCSIVQKAKILRVFPFTVKETLLPWHGSFVGK